MNVVASAEQKNLHELTERTEPENIIVAFSGLSDRALNYLGLARERPEDKIEIQNGKLKLRRYAGGSIREAVQHRILLMNGQEIILLALKNACDIWLDDTWWTPEEIMAIEQPRGNDGPIPILSYRDDPYPHLHG